MMRAGARPADGARRCCRASRRKALADRVLSFATARRDAREHHERVERQHALRRRRASRRRAASPTPSVTVTVTIGKRRASASTNVLDDASLKRTVELAATLARLSPEDPELMPELGPQTYAHGQRLRRAHRGSRSRSAQRRGEPRHRGGRRRPASRPATIFTRRIPRGQRARGGRRDEQRAVRLPPHDRRRLLGDGAHAGRHRQRLGERRRARLGRDRPGRDRPHRRAEGRGQPQPAGDRAGALHGGARAAGGHRPRAAARRRAQRAQRRRGAQPVLQARRRHAHRREGRATSA